MESKFLESKNKKLTFTLKRYILRLSLEAEEAFRNLKIKYRTVLSVAPRKLYLAYNDHYLSCIEYYI